MPPKLIVICGPTATGKTKLGVALAKALGGEVVSADSMQVYRDMAIGTARPTPEEMEGVPHHMLAVADPRENYSVARYVEEATARVEDILARGKVPLIVGGTGLYIDALCRGRAFSPFRGTKGVRQALQLRAAREGLAPLYEELRRADPAAAEKIHPNDEKRIIRALEVFLETGKPISQHDRESQAIPPRYDRATIALTYRDRAHLYARIDARVDQMMARGLLAEVEALLRAGVPYDATAMQAIGYKELVPAALGKRPVAQAVEEVKLRSRQYAKRQLTWFRRTEGALWIELEKDSNFSRVIQRSTDFLGENGVP